MKSAPETRVLSPREAAVSRLKISSGDQLPRSWVLAFALVALIYVATCGIPRLFDQIDGQYAGAAREMLARGDWLAPTQGGVPRLQKPPLVYWCEIASFSVLGTNEFAARLPVAIATIGWSIATGLIAYQVTGSRRAGLAASLLLSISVGSFLFTHLVMPEPFLACIIAFTFWCLIKGFQAKSISKTDQWFLAAWFLIGLGALTKGVHALAFPVAVTAISAFLKPATRATCSRFLLRPRGWLLFLALIVPWYAVTEVRFSGFLSDHVFNEQIGQLLDHRWPPDSDRVSLPLFWVQHLVLLFPAVLFIPAAIRTTRGLLGRSSNEKSTGGPAIPQNGHWLQGEGHLVLFWFLLNAFGITLSRLQDYYLMISWSPVAIWAGWAITRPKTSFKWTGLALAGLGALGLAIAALVGFQSHAANSGVPGLADGVNMLRVITSMPAFIWSEMLPLLWIVSAAALLGGCLIFFYRRSETFGLTALAFVMITTFAVCTRGLAIAQDQFSSAKVAQIINASANPDAKIVIEGDSNDRTSLFFYLQRPIFWVKGHPEMEFATRVLGIGRENYLTQEQVAELWNRPGSVFLLIQPEMLREWQQVLGFTPAQIVLSEQSGVLLCNRVESDGHGETVGR
jgi:4-amino-4-deoxy-L-arabinose transferase-like glycosyltransferase